MTVIVQTPFNQHVANGVTTVFGFTFQLLEAGDLQVRVGGVVVGGYSISGLGIQAGGSITFLAPPDNLAVVDIRRVIPLARSIDYQPNGDLPSDMLDRDIDRLWQAMQDAQFLSDLAVQLPVGDPAAPMVLPDLSTRAGQFLAFDALGRAIAAAGSAGVPVSTFIATLLDDIDAAAARATLVAAARGANSDITSLAGLTTPLSVAQGGTGAATALGARAALEAARGIFPVEASVAGNALTLTLNPTNLDFRSATLTSGASVGRVVAAALNLVISSGSTLGTANGVQSRIAILAIDNAGTVELAAVNAAGPFHFDESQLISTTAEGGAGAADSNIVVYSATARSNVAWRLVGFVDSTQATAGTWATAPSRKQGAGGLAFPPRAARFWQDMSASRVLGNTYTNPFSYEIELSVSIGLSGGSTSTLTVNGSGIANQSAGGTSENKNWSVTIQPGGTYSISTTGASISAWWELR